MKYTTTHRKNTRECLGKCASARESIAILKLSGVDTGILEAELDDIEQASRRVLDAIDTLEEQRKAQ